MTKITKISIGILGIGLLLVPLVASAFDYPEITCGADGNTQADALLCKVVTTMSLIFYLLIILGILYFVWGVVQYVTAGGDEEKAGAGRKTMMYAIIALAVVVGLVGLLNLINNYTGIQMDMTLIPFFTR